MTTVLPVEYDPFAADFYDDPFPVYRRMRDEAPVYYSERWGWWALSRFADVRAAATDPETFRSFEGIDIDDTAKDQSGPGFLPDLDNPRHDQIRALVQPHFLPRRIAAREGSVRRVVRGLVASWGQRSEVDLAQELAWPLPNEVFFDVLGLPGAREQGREQLSRWVHELKDRRPGDPRLTPVARAATAGIQDYFVRLLEERRRAPRADLVTHLVQATVDGVPFADEHLTPAAEVLGLLMVLFLGGVESTAGLTATVFKLLAEHPDQRELLRRDPSLVPAAVEEAIRVATPLQLVGRTTSREVVVAGVRIPAGARVVLVYGAANRDERQFADPDRFDVTRPRTRHLGFGEGLHGCLGAPLARLEAAVALEEALPLLGDYDLAAPPTRYRSTPNMYVWSQLPLRLSPARPGPRAPLPAAVSEPVTELRVEARPTVAAGVVALTLRSPDGAPLPAWQPGAHVDLLLDGGPTRQYSLCGDPADRTAYRLGVLRDPAGRGGSLHVHDVLREGDLVRVRGPRNHFPLAPAQEYLFLAGGIGITPLLTMVRAAEAAGTPWRLVYGGRQRASMAFLPELTAYGDRVQVCPQDEVGLLDLDGLLGTPLAGTHVYCCGPEVLLAAVERHCAGWPAGSLHVERFAPRPLDEDAVFEAFEVELARSGRMLTVPADRSVLSVVEQAGVPVLSSCSEGTCGTCETRVLAGVPDHRDAVLSPADRAAGDCLMICVSRSRSPRLVLDL